MLERCCLQKRRVKNLKHFPGIAPRDREVGDAEGAGDRRLAFLCKASALPDGPAIPFFRSLRADPFFNRYLGLKPQAESCHPFGILVASASLPVAPQLGGGGSTRVHSRLDSSFGFILQTFDFPVRFVEPLSFSSNSQPREAFNSARVQLLSGTVEG